MPNTVNRIGKKRRSEPAVPQNLENLLSTVQLYTLHQLENYGWHLAFVRRPLFQPVLPVVENPEHTAFGVIDEEGELELRPDLKTRR